MGTHAIRVQDLTIHMSNPKQGTSNRFIEQYRTGTQVFCQLFTHWMDRNRWTHPVMIKLIRAVLDGECWLHSSQISAIRHGTPKNPGPRSFMAIAELNLAIHEYATRKRLIPNTTTDLDYLQGFAVTEDGEAPSAGWWFEVFCGYRVPKDIELNTIFYDDEQAAAFSENYGRLIRQLVVTSGFDLLDDLPRVLRLHYPAGDTPRVDKLTEVLMKRTKWSAAEAHLELPALVGLSAELGGPANQDELLATTR